MRQAMPIPVTGLGCLCAAGVRLSACLAALDAGQRAPAPPQRLGSVVRRHPAFTLPESFFERAPGEEGLTHTVRMALTACREALSDAGLDEAALGGLRVGVCLGTSVGAALDFLDLYAAMRKGEPADDADLRRYLAGNPALATARALGCTGPVQTVTNACSSGTDAIGIAASWIREGLCDVVLAGGADALSPVTYIGFMRLMITDENPCRPFDVRRAGLNLGEGAGVVVLEGSASAARRAAPSRGVVLGYGTACDAYHLTAPHPDGLGLERALVDALEQAGAMADEVAFVNAHGTGTRNNDVVEALVACRALPGVPLVATKGMTGHTLGAAGAIEAVFTLAHLRAGVVPASVGFGEQDPELGVAPTTALTPVSGRVAVSQSLAFGGNNSVLVLGRGEDR